MSTKSPWSPATHTECGFTVPWVAILVHSLFELPLTPLGTVPTRKE